MTHINSVEYQEILQPAWKEHFSSTHHRLESQEKCIQKFAEFIGSHFSCESDFAEFYARCVAKEIPYNTIREEFKKWSAARQQSYGFQFPSFSSEIFNVKNLPSISLKTVVTVAIGVAAFATIFFFRSNESESG